MAESQKSETNSLTGVEREAHEIVDMLRALCVIYHLKPEKTSRGEDPGEGIDGILQNLQKWQSATARAWIDTCTVQKTFGFSSFTETRDLNWEYFHKIFVLLDLFRLILQTLDYAVAENRKRAVLDQHQLDESSKHMRKSIADLWTSIHEATSKVRDQLRQPGAAAKMVEVAFDDDDNDDGRSQNGNAVGLELRALIGVPRLEEIAADMCSSWIDGLDGILRTKMV